MQPGGPKSGSVSPGTRLERPAHRFYRDSFITPGKETCRPRRFPVTDTRNSHPAPRRSLFPRMNQRYEVKGKLGHGGLGEVYLAYDTQLDREVALKRVKPQEDNETSTKTLAADLVREAKTLSALQHPNIVTIYDVGTDEKGPYVVMEYLKGETLDQVIERGRVDGGGFSRDRAPVHGGHGRRRHPWASSTATSSRGNVMVNWLPSGKIPAQDPRLRPRQIFQTAVPQTQDQGAGIFGSIFFMAPEQFERLAAGCAHGPVFAGLHLLSTAHAKAPVRRAHAGGCHGQPPAAPRHSAARAAHRRARSGWPTGSCGSSAAKWNSARRTPAPRCSIFWRADPVCPPPLPLNPPARPPHP